MPTAYLRIRVSQPSHPVRKGPSEGPEPCVPGPAQTGGPPSRLAGDPSLPQAQEEQTVSRSGDTTCGAQYEMTGKTSCSKGSKNFKIDNKEH